MTTNKLKKTLSVMGVAAASMAAVLSTTGCSTNKIQKAQDKLGDTVVEKLNEESVKKDDFFSKFTFLCANVLKNEDAGRFNIDISGTGKYKNIGKETYTTLSFDVDNKYFEGKQLADTADVIDTFTEIVANEQMESLSSVNVSSAKKLNDSMRTVTLDEAEKYVTQSMSESSSSSGGSLYDKIEGTLEDKYNDFQNKLDEKFGNDKLIVSNNMLYNVSNIKIDEKKGVATFSTKELSEFEMGGLKFNILAANHIMQNLNRYGSFSNIYGNGVNPYLFGLPVVPATEEGGTYFIDNSFSVELTPEEIELAKQDKSVVLDKFCHYVKSGQKDKYTITHTSISDLSHSNTISSGNNSFAANKTSEEQSQQGGFGDAGNYFGSGK